MRDATKPMTPEQRRHERYQVTDVIQVFDVFAECPLGRLVDISLGGMLLSSEDAIPLNQIFQTAIVLPGSTTLELGVESLWSRPSSDGGQVWTGFQLISVSEQDRAVLERLIEAL
jgi:c-di-GMP-binding flagellar brake protein YcgR